MISGANEEELELASARMDIMLATNYTPDNPGPLAIIDKYHDKEIERLNNIIDELKWKSISEYENPKYDWVLIKFFIKEDNFECVPIVAEKRPNGKWYLNDDTELNEDIFEIKYFMDMQQIDKLKALKESK